MQFQYIILIHSSNIQSTNNIQLNLFQSDIEKDRKKTAPWIILIYNSIQVIPKNPKLNRKKYFIFFFNLFSTYGLI